jgi:hypothetical protein
MSLLCSYCHKEIIEAPIAVIHLECASKIMELGPDHNRQNDENKPHCYHCKKRKRGCIRSLRNFSCFENFVHV